MAKIWRYAKTIARVIYTDFSFLLGRVIRIAGVSRRGKAEGEEVSSNG